MHTSTTFDCRVASAALRRKTDNLRQLADDLAAQRRVFRSLPDVVGLHTTDVCNLRCVMCPRAERPGRTRVPADVLARVCDELFPTARRAVFSPAHGEPLVSDFDLVMDAARRHSVRVDLVTNGTLLTPERYRHVRPALNVLNVSLDSHVPKTYEQIRVGAVFADVDARLRELTALRRSEPDDVVWSASAVVMRSNLEQLPGFVAYAARRGFDAVVLQPLRQSARRIPEEDPFQAGRRATERGRQAAAAPVEPGRLPAAAAVERTFVAAEAAARRHGVNLYFTDFQRPAIEVRAVRPVVELGESSPTACWSLFHNFSIQPTGDVYPCCHPTDHRLGNVIDQPAVAIWNGPAMRRLRAAHFSRRGTAFCNGCLYAPYLPAGRPGPLRRALRAVRIIRGHVADRLRQRRRR